MNILVTGGAGYIGSHMSRMLVARGITPVVVDTLERGHRQALPDKAVLVTGDVGDPKLLDTVFQTHAIEGVIHFAGYIFVGESVEKPGMYFENNLVKPRILLDAMLRHSVKTLIFSSTAAVYGTPVTDPIPEDHDKKPDSPYGLSKWFFEELLDYYDRHFEVRSIRLRYFNAAGADLSGEYGEAHDPELHIIPLAFQTALGKRDTFSLYGTDYNTPDGTCIRDYIHIEDLCMAHVKALDALKNGHRSEAFNVGTGKGHTNREIVAEVKRVTGVDFPVHEEARRPGDPHSLVADSEKIRQDLMWAPKYSDLTGIIGSAWKWHKKHPDGYNK